MKWLMPARLGKLIPGRIGRGVEELEVDEPVATVLLLNGCAQQVSTPATNQTLQSLLAKLRVSTRVLADEGCCGSLDLHAGDEPRALERIKANIDRMTPHLEEVEAIVSSASGCGLTMKEWGRVLAQDPDYAQKAAAISAKVQDVAEYVTRRLTTESPSVESVPLEKARDIERVAWHAPCTLQHGQQLTGIVEPLLTQVGYKLVPVADAHLCCGSAGTYSALQPRLAGELAQRKLAALQKGDPELIATANVGCQTHLANNSSVPIVHWIELLK